MKYSEDFVVSIAVQILAGLSYLSYTLDETDALGPGWTSFMVWGQPVKMAPGIPIFSRFRW
jgi:hypothetical protein